MSFAFSRLSTVSAKDVGKVAGAVTAVATAYYVGTYLKFRITEKLKPFNHYTNSWEVVKNEPMLKNKVVIVTGCNTGIGKETVKQLYLSGCVVVMACRSEDRAQNARNDILNADGAKAMDPNNLIIIRLDLGDLRTIDEFVDKYRQNKIINGRLDYLINNAGVMAFPKFTATAKENIEMQFGVNHIGHFYLTNKLMDVIKSNKTRIINLSSSANNFATADVMRRMLAANKNGPTDEVIPYTPWGYYGISKLSNVLFTRYLNKLYHKDGVTAVCLHPGGINTELGRNMKLKFLEILYFLPRMIYFKNVPQGASTTLRCVTISDNEIYNGEMDDIEGMNLFFDDTRPQTVNLNKEFRNNKNCDIDEALWKYSERIIQSFDYLSMNDST